jgi:hypothetical protein
MNITTIELSALGHTVKLMAPQFVKPYVKSNMNDARDAEAICEAVGRPSMRFVAIKTPEQQALLALHRARQELVRARTRARQSDPRTSSGSCADSTSWAAKCSSLRRPLETPSRQFEWIGELLTRAGDARHRRLLWTYPSPTVIHERATCRSSLARHD